jgi:hypothetical protein
VGEILFQIDVIVLPDGKAQDVFVKRNLKKLNTKKSTRNKTDAFKYD